MKTTIVTAVLAIALLSCKKERTCHCTVEPSTIYEYSPYSNDSVIVHLPYNGYSHLEITKVPFTFQPTSSNKFFPNATKKQTGCVDQTVESVVVHTIQVLTPIGMQTGSVNVTIKQDYKFCTLK